MEDEHDIIESSLSRTMTESGRTFRVEIYRSANSGWFLEVLNEADTSIVWNDEFPTDQEALDELVRTMREEGIDALLDGEQPGAP